MKLISIYSSPSPNLIVIFVDQGPHTRALSKGDDIHLHFQSQNPEEQNGAVRMTFQSQLPGFTGVKANEENELMQTAALRVLSQILKEPFFNQLRTKEQLGYVVKSYYDIDFSLIRPSIDDSDGAFLTMGTLPINYIEFSILSRKLPPPEISERIDVFLEGFRGKLR